MESKTQVSKKIKAKGKKKFSCQGKECQTGHHPLSKAYQISNSQLKELLLPWRTVPHAAHWYTGANSGRIPRQPGHLTSRTLEVD